MFRNFLWFLGIYLVLVLAGLSIIPWLMLAKALA